MKILQVTLWPDSGVAIALPTRRIATNPTEYRVAASAAIRQQRLAPGLVRMHSV